MASELLTRIRGEIDQRLRELRPALEEYERLLGDAEDVDEEIRAARGARSRSRPVRRAPASRNGNGDGAGRGRAPRGAARGRAPRGAAQEAIVAALEHGSHTVSELAVVTAMPGPNLRQSLRRLVTAGNVTQSKREGKLAYALASRRRSG